MRFVVVDRLLDVAWMLGREMDERRAASSDVGSRWFK